MRDITWKNCRLHVNINQSEYPLKILYRLCLLKLNVVSLSSYFHTKTDFINTIPTYFCKSTFKERPDKIRIKELADIADFLFCIKWLMKWSMKSVYPLPETRIVHCCNDSFATHSSWSSTIRRSKRRGWHCCRHWGIGWDSTIAF